jgi:hypothetical protein
MSKKLLFNFNREVIQNYTYVKYAGTIITATNTLEKPIKSAILKGSTKYRNIDTGEVLDTFDEGRNLELVSVKTPVLTTSGKNLFSDNLLNGKQVKENGKYKAGTSNSKNDKFVIDKLDGKKQYTITLSCITDSWTNFYVKYTNGEGRQYPIGNKSSYIITTNKPPYEVDYMCSWGSSASFLYDIQIEEGSVATSYEPPKSNILTVNEDVTLRSNGSVYDELDLLTGKLTQRIDEDGSVLTQEVVKTVDLSILDQNENKVSSISSFNDTTHIMASSETIPPTFEGYLATKEVE